MARRARNGILYDGCLAHVYSRALEQRRIFETVEDFNEFKRLLKGTKQECGYRIYHYCLMNTHFHLAVGLGSWEKFSQGLKVLKQRYAMWVRKKRRRAGPVWWGRFGSRLIEDERYLYASGLYIEHNPVEAGLVKRPEEWAYSSSAHYFLEREDDLVDSYDPPAFEEGFELMRKLKDMKGKAVGSELFQIHMNEGVLT